MIQDMLAADITFILLKWLILIIIWICLAFGLYRDHKKIRKFHDSSITSAMLRILQRRNLHIFGLVTMLLVVLLANDLSHEVQLTQATASATPAEKAPEPAPPATPAATTAPKAEDTNQFAIPQNSKIPFSEIPEFNETNSKQQAYIDFLKERYETWLITYYYLQKCGKTNSADLDTILASLRKGLQSAHADSAVEANILSAANGSYKEMYSDIPCSEAHITSTKSGYDSSMRQLKDAPVTSPLQSTPSSTASQPNGSIKVITTTPAR